MKEIRKLKPGFFSYESYFAQVMIMDLALHVQNFLHTHSRPKMRSFHEEMLKMRKLSEEAKLLRMKTAEEEEVSNGHQIVFPLVTNSIVLG